MSAKMSAFLLLSVKWSGDHLLPNILSAAHDIFWFQIIFGYFWNFSLIFGHEIFEFILVLFLDPKHCECKLHPREFSLEDVRLRTCKNRRWPRWIRRWKNWGWRWKCGTCGIGIDVSCSVRPKYWPNLKRKRGYCNYNELSRLFELMFVSTVATN